MKTSLHMLAGVLGKFDGKKLMWQHGLKKKYRPTTLFKKILDKAETV